LQSGAVLMIANAGAGFGGPTRIRTWDQPVMSRMVYHFTPNIHIGLRIRPQRLLPNDCQTPD
jgi:hypothetical protein